ncbi:MAG: TRAP transporter large permease [Pelagibacteraceae bacterium]|jgi:C4-dicarboxylate transporter DctM subunit|nr:TRAP transporter large permease [bacterium]MDB0036712.1 TRAP transporter large permease [Pelagibacteraceae bacterium]|tara:strand:+ start:1205 stop:2548 length:1344 start_codon:yes stop_codon:yes gene_type:complete
MIENMDPLTLGAVVGIFTVMILFSGIPIAFGLCVVSLVFLVAAEGVQIIEVYAETFYSGINSFILLSIPMFILMGMAVAHSPAGKDLYTGLDRWLWRLPGGLVISNIGACAVFAALSGSSPATCAAIGTMGIPEMRKRGYSARLATGCIAAGGTLGVLIPPSIVLIVYGLATGTSIGRLFLAGVIPGILLAFLFMFWAYIHAYYIDKDSAARLKDRTPPTLKEKLEVLPRILPFLAIVAGVLYVLYGGVATPSEASGVGAFLVFVMIAVVYKIYQPKKIWDIVKISMKESVMIMFIIAASYIFAFSLSTLYVTQSIAQVVVDMGLNKWLLFFYINIFLLVCGFFLPPVAVIVMTSSILLPILTDFGFDPYWFAIVFTINMEIGLITPPVGLNLYIIKGITPDVSLGEILKGSIPFIGMMILCILILCIFPEIVTWLPDKLMGKDAGF